MNARRTGLLLCLIASTAAAATVWVSTGYPHTATVMFLLAGETPSLLLDNHGRLQPGAYGKFKATQRQIVMGDAVLNEVLRSPEVANLPNIRGEESPLTWLREHISVSFSEDSDLMSVNVTSRDASEAGQLANAVSEAYLQQVASTEQSYAANLRTTLQAELDKNKSAIAMRRANLQQLLKLFGLSDDHAVPNMDRFTRNALEIVDGELVHTQLEILRLQAKLDAKTARYERLMGPESKELEACISELDLENAAVSDPVMCELRTRLGKLPEPVADALVEPASADPETELPANAEREKISEQMDSRLAELRVALQGQVLTKLRNELAQIGDELAIQESIEKQLAEKERRIRAETAVVASRQTDIDEEKREITVLEDVSRRLHQAILEHDLTNAAPPRVLRVSPGTGSTPETRSPNTYSRLWMSIAAALATWLLVPAAVILLRFPWWLFRIAFPSAPNR